MFQTGYNDNVTILQERMYEYACHEGNRGLEYSCHEGNYAMFNILSGARADEKAAARGSCPR